MDRFKNQKREWEGTYKNLIRLTGFSFGELYDRCLAVIKDKSSKYYGSLGIVECSGFENWNYVYYIRFKENKRRVKLSFEFGIKGNWQDLEKKIFDSPNAVMIFAELESVQREIKKAREQEYRVRYPLLKEN